MSKNKPTSPKTAYQLTTAQHCVIYSCGLRTIERYRAKELPLDDLREMWSVWGASKNMPDSVRAKGLPAILADFEAVAGRPRQPPAAAAASPANEDAEPSDVSTASLGALPGGAEHELRSLASLAAAARRNLIRANAGNNALTRKQALDAYVKLAESLLRYDRSVDPSRRDSGEVVARAQIEEPITALTVWLRRGIENFLNGVCLQIAEAEKPEEVYAVIAEPLRQCLGQAVNAACGDGKFPLWMRQAFERGL